MTGKKQLLWPCLGGWARTVHATRTGGTKTLCGREIAHTNMRRTFQNYAATYPDDVCKTCLRITAVGEGGSHESAFPSAL